MENQERKLMLKNEITNIKFEEKVINHRRQEKIQEFERVKSLEKIIEKTRKIDEYK